MIERASPLRPQRLRSRNENGGGRLSHTLRQACGDRTPEVAHPTVAIQRPVVKRTDAPGTRDPASFFTVAAMRAAKRTRGWWRWGETDGKDRGRAAARRARGKTGNAPSPGFWLQPPSANVKKCIRPAHSLNSQRRYTRRTRPDHMFFKACFYNEPCKRKIPLLSVCTAFPL